MKVKLGDLLECEFGKGHLVAITSQWAIIRDPKDGGEYAIHLADNWISVPAEFDGETKSEKTELEIEQGD